MLQIPSAAANWKRILELKGSAQGKRVFVIGNGPSLTMADLDAIQGEISIGCNKCYQFFPHTAWRPTFWTLIDRTITVQRRNEFMAEGGVRDITRVIPRDNIHLCPALAESILVDNLRIPNKKIGFSRDLTHGACGGWTVIHLSLQLAYWLGASEVYLLGLDWDYAFDASTARPDPASNQTVVSPEYQNHAVAGYIRDGEVWAIPQLDKTTAAMREAKVAFDEAGVKVRNLSRNTKLDVFERATLESVLSERES